MVRIGIVVFLAAFFISGCKKKQIKNIEKALVEGNWRVTKFIDDNENHTNSISESKFTFSNDGSVTVTGATTTMGTWDVAKENDSDDDDINEKNHVEFILNLPVPLDELSEDWEIETNSDTKLELKDQSKNGETIDYLTFEKI